MKDDLGDAGVAVDRVARADDGRVLGLHILLPGAEEVIQTGVPAVKHAPTVTDIAETIFPYLTGA